MVPPNKRTLHLHKGRREDINPFLKRSFFIKMKNNTTVKFDKSNVKLFNCNKKGHFAREYRANKRGKFKGRFNASTATEDEPTR